MAFRGSDKLFLTVQPGAVAAGNAESTGQASSFTVLSCAERKKASKGPGKDYEIEGGTLASMEYSFARKFQSFADGKVRAGSDVGELKRAKEAGQLHGALLDRRSKQKADKYCK